MQESESPAHAISEAESEDTVDRFHESLQVRILFSFSYFHCYAVGFFCIFHFITHFAFLSGCRSLDSCVPSFIKLRITAKQLSWIPNKRKCESLISYKPSLFYSVTLLLRSNSWCWAGILNWVDSPFSIKPNNWNGIWSIWRPHNPVGLIFVKDFSFFLPFFFSESLEHTS